MTDTPIDVIAALRPPKEYEHLRWHWIEFPFGQGLEPKEWNGAEWLHAVRVTPDQARRAGWRYHGPCDPAANVPDVATQPAWTAEKDHALEQILLHLERFNGTHMADWFIKLRRAAFPEKSPPDIRAALQAVRDDALREAADKCQVVHDREDGVPRTTSWEQRGRDAICLGALRCRDAIRALIDAPDAKEPPDA